MNLLDREPAALLLEDGTIYRGRAYGARGDTAGEVVFNTSMTGYQEILTDPSYRAQIVTMTYPHMGNYGINLEDVESGRVQVAGFIVREPCAVPSNWRSTGDLESYLAEAGVVGLCGIDTRALVRRIRQVGAMRGAILTGEAATEAALAERLAAEPPMTGRDLVGEVTCSVPYAWHEPVTPLPAALPTAGVAQPDRPYRVVAYDFGIKHNILRLLTTHGCEVTVVPATTSAEDVMAMDPDGIFLSNGPGDPAAVHYAIDSVRALIGQRPMFGICLGHQIAALALGAQTFKLPFGHRGGNQPVKDLRTGQVAITSQNHGFAVSPDGLGGGAVVSHVNLNDDTVAGLSLTEKQLFSVQYHPEASPGPHDADALFADFTRLMAEHRA